MQTIEKNEMFTCYIHVKGIKKRERKVKSWFKEVSKIPINYNDKDLLKAKYLCLDWCENNLREVHSNMFLKLQVEFETVFNNDPNNVMITSLPFDNRNKTFNLTCEG